MELNQIYHCRDKNTINKTCKTTEITKVILTGIFEAVFCKSTKRCSSLDTAW